MAATRRLTELVESAVERLRLPEGPVLVALSGGADSAALSLLCLQAGRHTRTVHVDHGLPHSPLMRRAAMAVADRLGVAIDVLEVSMPAGPSPEDRARRARYDALAGSPDGGESLLTAHTREDDAETILLNLIRGTGPEGLRGIPYQRSPNIYRPALDIGRSETREIASLDGLPFADDPMNDDPTLTRNWLRLTIMPRLAEQNPRIVHALRRAGEAVGRDASYLDDMADAQTPKLAKGEASHPRSSIITAPRPVADRVLMRMLGHVAGRSAVTSERVARVWDVVEGRSAAEEVGAGAAASLRGPMLVIAGDSVSDEGSEGRLEPGTNRLGGRVFEVREMTGVCQVAPLSKWSALFPVDTRLGVGADGVVTADGEPAWIPGERRLPVAWYRTGEAGYLLVLAREEA